MRSHKSKEHIRVSRAVSCHFCRSRKLRCCRQFPCFNCTSRGISCQLYSAHAPAKSRPEAPDSQSDEILARLGRLEDLVLGKNGQALQKTADASEQVPSQQQSQITYEDKDSPTDAEYLERVCMHSSCVSILADEIVFRPYPIRQITKSPSYIYLNPSPTSPIGEPVKCVWLPCHAESKRLLEKYANDISYIHHVIHVPSVDALVDDLYMNLSQGDHIKTGHVALLLSILASTTYSWTPPDCSRGPFSAAEEANEQCIIWTRATLDVLEYSRRVSSGSLEDVQAMIIILFVIYNLEGLSTRYRFLVSTAITTARDLALHRIDQQSPTASAETLPRDSIQAEIGRRVWWYLVATDGMLGLIGGPQGSIYTINSRHMVVNKPRNINDEDLVDGMSTFEQPLCQPTSMSYFLQRIRMAELCRDFIDSIPLSLSSSENVSYSQVLEIDSAFHQYIKEIPPFFRLDGDSLEQLSHIDPRRAPGIIIQRYILNSLVYSLRLKLHLPYLTRCSSDPTYLHSRETCLESARHIIQTERMLEKESLPFVLTRLRFSPVLQFAFMAVIVPLVDMCVNKCSASEEQARKAEMADAFSILEDARDQSPMGAKLLDSLMGVLRRYKVSFPVLDRTRLTSQELSASEQKSRSSDSSTWESPENSDRCGSVEGQQRPSNSNATSFDMWQNLDVEMDIDNLDWNSLFAELESGFI